MSEWPVCDDLPVVLVTLDGLGDRPCAALAGATPAEMARTPILDELTRRGAAGVHEPFGPGWATSSERAHWAMFGLADHPFPGRAALELLGVGGQVEPATPMWHLAVRRGEERAGVTRIIGRLSPDESDLAASATRVLVDVAESFSNDGVSFELRPLRTGEWVLIGRGAVSHEVSDTDPLFEHRHPWMRPRALAEAEAAGGSRALEAHRSARALENFLVDAHIALRGAGLDADVPTTKWGSRLDGDLAFQEAVGVSGAMVTSSALYRGFARLLSMRERDVRATPGDPAIGLGARVTAAVNLLNGDDVPDFIHVHTKAPDEAGHTKDPLAKVAAIEACDAALEPLVEQVDSTPFVLAVTGDHATPSETLLLHSGDPTPFVMLGPDTRVDRVTSFGERSMLDGSLGSLRARDIAPLLHSQARRPFFWGHRPGTGVSAAMPSVVAAMDVPVMAGTTPNPTPPISQPQESYR